MSKLPKPQLVFLFLVLLSVVLYVLPHSGRAFVTRGEGREALVVWEMFFHGRLVVPYRSITEIASKPPFFHWLANGFSHLNGALTEGSIRLASGVTACLAAAVFYLFLVSRIDGRTSLFSLLLLLTSFEWVRSASHARVDMVFAFWLTLAFICIYSLLEEIHRSSSRLWFWILTGGISAGCAVLSKGPAGLALPGVATCLYVLCSSRCDFFPRPLRYLAPLFALAIIAFAIGFAWYFAAYEIDGMEFVRKQLVEENVGRLVEVQGFDTGHHSPFYFSLIQLLVSLLPWSIFVPLAAAHFWQRRAEIPNRFDGLLLFSLIWLVLFVVIISLSESKREVYFLPALPQACLLLACAITEGTPASSAGSRFGTRFALAAVGILALVFSLIPLASVLTYAFGKQFVVDHVPFPPPQGELAQIICRRVMAQPSFVIVAVVVVFYCWKAFGAMSRRTVGEAVRYLVVSSILTVLYASFVVLPVVAESTSPREFMAEVLGMLHPRKELYQYREEYYSAMYYSGRRIETLSSPEELNRARGNYILVRRDFLPEVERVLSGCQTLKESETLAANGKEHLVLLSVPKHLAEEGPFEK